MEYTSGYLLKDTRYKLGIRLTTVWMVIFLLIGGILAPQFFIQANAAPVIIEGESGGSWEDTFEDLSGVDVIDSVILTENGVILDTNIFDNFTGNNGDSPDTSKWDLIDDGYTLEIQNNQLMSSAPGGSWRDELIQTNASFSLNHTLTWKQELHTNSGGMYYHFFILDGSDDSWIFGLDQNNVNTYQYQNFEASTSGTIATSVSGWHDFKITYENSYVKFYFDGSLEFEYDFIATSVKYKFGTHCLNQASTIYTDDIIINSTMSGNLTSEEIFLPPGKTWERLMLNKTESTGNTIELTLLDGVTFLPIPGFENLTDSDMDLSSIDILAYPTLRIFTHFLSNGFASPILHSYNVTWLDDIPPATPSGFAVNNPFTGFSLIISWDPNLEADLNNYVLYYSTDNSTFNKLTNLSSDSVSYIHYGRIINQTYYYKVAAADKIPNESPPTLVGEGTPDLDYDGDGMGNMADLDDDNDGIPDTIDPYPLNPLNVMEIKIDNIQNIVENLNITEFTDAIDYLNQTLPLHVDQLSDLLANITDLNITNLMEYLKDMNASLYTGIQNLLTEITNDINDMLASLVILEGNLSSQHDVLNSTIYSLENLISNEQALTRSEILDALNDSMSLLQNLDNNMTSHDVDIKNILAAKDALIHNENNLTRSQLIDNVTDILNRLDTVDQNILNEISALNFSVSDQLMDLLNNMTTDQDALRSWLEIVIPTLDANITDTNVTLHKQLDDLDTLMTSFYDDLDSDLAFIITDIQNHDSNTGQNHSDIIDLLDSLPDDIGEMDLDELKAMLTNLAQNISLHDQAMADDILGVVSNIESFDSESQQKLDDINNTLSALAHLQNILAELDALEISLSEAEQQLQESIDEIPTDKEEKEDQIGLVEILLLVILILLIINILVSIMGGKKRKSDEQPVQPTYGHSEKPILPAQPQVPMEEGNPPIEDEQSRSIDKNEDLPQVPPPPPE